MSAPVNILLVNDNPADVERVRACVDPAEIHVELQGSVEAAAQQLRRRTFDLLLVDLSLPDSQGLSSFKLLHGLAHDAPVIVLAHQDDTALAARAVVEGAKDYLFKHRIREDSLVGLIRSAIARSRRQPAESELSAVGKIQRRLFIGDKPPQLDGFDIGCRSSASAFACGDLLDFVSFADDRLGIVIGDVVGRGIMRGITMCETRATIRAFSSVCDDVSEILTRSNSVLSHSLSQETFVALFFASVESSSQTVRFASAGHAAFVLDADGRAKRLLKTDDPPLGFGPSTNFQTTVPIRLEVGEALLLMSDRLSDGIGRSGSRFGKKQVLEMIRAEYARGSRSALDHVFEQIKGSDGTRQEDDVTAVLVKAQATFSPPPAPASEPAAEKIVFREAFRHFDVESDTDDPIVIRLRDTEILSSESVNDLSEELQNYLAESAATQVIICFRSVKKFTSDGINACLMIKQSLSARGASLRLCDMRQSIRDAFAALNLDGAVFDIHDTVADALHAGQARDGPPANR